MALENYRITEFQEKTQVDNGDYVLIDSATDGTHKYQLSRIPAQASAEVDAAVAAEKAQRQAADAELAGDIGTLSSGKVDKVAGKGLSTNDFTDALKTKLDGIEAGAEVNDVTSVAGKTGAVTLGGGDVSYSDETTYAEGTVGAAIGDVKSDLTYIFSDEAKQALVDCLDNLLWKAGSGSQYIEALKTALNMSSNPFESAAYEIGALGYLYDTVLDEGCVRFIELNTRARLTQPVPCTHGKLIAKTGYEINCYFLNSTEYGEFVTSGGVHYTGYTDLEYKASSLYQWETEKEILAGTNYVILALRKTSGDEFIQSEMNTLYGTAFEYEEVSE